MELSVSVKTGCLALNYLDISRWHTKKREYHFKFEKERFNYEKDIN